MKLHRIEHNLSVYLPVYAQLVGITGQYSSRAAIRDSILYLVHLRLIGDHKALINHKTTIYNIMTHLYTLAANDFHVSCMFLRTRVVIFYMCH